MSHVARGLGPRGGHGRVMRPALHHRRPPACRRATRREPGREGGHAGRGHSHRCGQHDDVDELRSGGMRSLFTGIYARSTLGEFLGSLHHGNVRQLQAPREFPGAALPPRTVAAGRGCGAFLDVDSLLRRVYGKQKQGTGFGHAKVGGYQLLLRGLNPLIATLSTRTRPADRRRPAASRRGCQHLLPTPAEVGAAGGDRLGPAGWHDIGGVRKAAQAARGGQGAAPSERDVDGSLCFLRGRTGPATTRS